MPLYYFDIIDDGICNHDEFGIELADIHEAREQAQALLPDIARTEMPGGENHTFVCEVREEERGVVYRGSLVYHGQIVSDPSMSRLAASAD